jgi:hypothetical protein
MKKELIESLVKQDRLRPRQLDLEKVKSMLKHAEMTVNVIKKIPLDDDSAIVIFREAYESIRQLGDAEWWLNGYEPRDHEVSMDILKEFDIKEKVSLNYLPRFKRIRNDANYRGFKITVAQAQEIMEFWEKCCKDIVGILNKRVKK